MDENLLSRINAFADGELENREESSLFEQLAIDTEARNYFKKIGLLRNEIERSDEEFPSSLESVILNKQLSFPGKRFSIKNAHFAGVLTGLISIILLIISILLLSEVSSYRNEINSVLEQVKAQNKTIEALYNSLPPIDVKAAFSNEIIIKPKI